MFKIDRLIMKSTSNKEYEYKFTYGINYFKGGNNTGKTEFYRFIDYMFGASEDISKRLWYKDTLEKATIEITYNNMSYVLTRTMDKDVNYFRYKDEEDGQCISLDEYKDRLNSVFVEDEELLKDIRSFTEENLTYRSFTMFNFLGEKRQGVLNDFFDKCSDIAYSVKLNSILNFIFNNNLEYILELKKELQKLIEEVKELERKANKFEFISSHINNNLKKIGVYLEYDGKNHNDIKKVLNKIKNMEELDEVVIKEKGKRISELEVIYNNIEEQIKVYKNRIHDSKNLNAESKNRKLLLSKLELLIRNNEGYDYLVNPLIELTKEVENSISFNKYIIKDNTIKELAKQKEIIKEEIKCNDYRFRRFDINEKTKAIAVIEEYLEEDVNYDSEGLNEKRKRIKIIKEEIKFLQNSNDMEKIRLISESITDLYKTAKDVSGLVSEDLQMNGFKIQYFKKSNLLQPMIRDKDDEYNNYYPGSMARHTLIQLCGYLGFLHLLINEHRYPLIPILVIDHISKPFDLKNRKAIGIVFKKAYEKIGKENLQTFIFDDKLNSELHLEVDHYEDLKANKTGFNPFYNPM